MRSGSRAGMIRRTIGITLLSVALLIGACALSSYWRVSILAYGFDKDSDERTMQTYLLLNEDRLVGGSGRGHARRSWLVQVLGSLSPMRSYTTLFLADGMLQVRRMTRLTASPGYFRLHVPFLVEEVETGWMEKSLVGLGTSQYVQTKASLHLFRLAALLAAMPLLVGFIAALRTWHRRRQRRRRNQCIPCGYDLTGNTSGVCPECGGRASED